MKATYTPPGESPTAYNHDDQDINILQFACQHSYSDDQLGGRYLGLTKSITIEWVIRGTSQADLFTKMGLAEAAYVTAATQAGGSLIVKHDNGDTSRHTMPATAGSGGVGTRVIDFGYRPNDGVEYATRRTAYAVLTHGAIIDLSGGAPNTPGSPGDDFASGTDIPGYNWGTGQHGDGSFPDSGAVPFDVFETYEVEGGDIIDIVEELPSGGPYIWRKTDRAERKETHTINIIATGQFAAIPATIISSGGAEIRRKVSFGRRSGNPPRYQTTVTYTKRS